MIARRLLDTNLIVRHLTQDHERHAAIAAKLFAACDRRELAFVLLPIVLAECVFVLESFYQHSRESIAGALSSLIASPGIEIDDLAIHIDALDRYTHSRLPFVDCLLAAHAASNRLSIATLDKGFQKFPDVQIEVDV